MPRTQRLIKARRSPAALWPDLASKGGRVTGSISDTHPLRLASPGLGMGHNSNGGEGISVPGEVPSDQELLAQWEAAVKALGPTHGPRGQGGGGGGRRASPGPRGEGADTRHVTSLDQSVSNRMSRGRSPSPGPTPGSHAHAASYRYVSGESGQVDGVSRVAPEPMGRMGLGQASERSPSDSDSLDSDNRMLIEGGNQGLSGSADKVMHEQGEEAVSGTERGEQVLRHQRASSPERGRGHGSRQQGKTARSQRLFDAFS